MEIELAALTKNKKGFTYALTSFGKAFIKAAEKATRPVMDVGAAYGVATLPALQTGAEVIAVDIEEKHLSAIFDAVDTETRTRLTLLKGRFPYLDLPAESLSAVYLSQVIPFLNGPDIEIGIRKIYDWLVPGGEVFVVSFSPYIKHISAFIPIFEQRQKEGMRWAGQIDDLSQFSSNSYFIANLPKQVHHVGLNDLKWVFERTGFILKEARYFGEEEGPLPEDVGMDGRERVGLIARKL
jgi:SAM-dependent methyltransferase